MRLEVRFTPGELVPAELANQTAVVIDALRATSTIVEALANGARAVFPQGSIDEAVRLAQNLGRENVLLCGERRGLRIEGFDLGNSPLEFTPERVASKVLVMTTTNGTATLLTAGAARRTLVASFLNLGAVAEALAAGSDPVTIICAGREGRFALEDAVCAGALVLRVQELSGEELVTNDAAVAAMALARDRAASPVELLRETAAGKSLIEAGFEADVEYCAAIDRHRVVPELRDRQITL